MGKNLKIFAKTIEQSALDQINTLMAQEAFSGCKVRIMPDVHSGADCVIGFTADLGEKVIPNVVGVDIGCGMYCTPIGNDDVDFEKLDEVIRKYVPSGMAVNDTTLMEFDFKKLVCYDSLKNLDWIEKSVGSLGGGNHFIEVDVDSDGDKFLVIHSGSRNLGKQVAEIYQNRAISKMCGKDKFKEICDKTISDLKSAGREKEIAKELKLLKLLYDPEMSVPKELCYLDGKERDCYLSDMRFCQNFAHWNRILIAKTICSHMGWEIEPDGAFETIHNYIDHDSNIVRKGAVSAKKGERLLIPINMRDGCIVAVGKGNEDWNCSAPHGAGRIMSRMQAKKSLDLKEYADTMSRVFTTSVSKSTIDEAPQAYKPMQEILDCIGDTVKIEQLIKPIYNFKAGD